jgi:hypothetical protein
MGFQPVGSRRIKSPSSGLEQKKNICPTASPPLHVRIASISDLSDEPEATPMPVPPNPESDEGTAIILSFATAMILAASILPWAYIPPLYIRDIWPEMPVEALLESRPPFSAWETETSLFGCVFPNVFVPFTAVLLTIFAWLKSAGMWRCPNNLLLGLAGYGLLQTLDFIYEDCVIGYSTVGPGSLLTVAMFAIIICRLYIAPHLAPVSPSPPDVAIQLPPF